MGVATSLAISVEEYLHNPAFEHYEYVDGQPAELHVGRKDHARTKARCAAKLDEHFDTHPRWVGTGLHCQLSINGSAASRTVVSGETLTGGDLLPDLAFPADYLFA